MSKKLKNYDKEFKQNAVNLCLSSDRDYSKIAKDLGVPNSTLHSWVKAPQKDGNEAFPGKGSIILSLIT